MKIRTRKSNLPVLLNGRMILMLLALLCYNGASAQDDDDDDPRKSFEKARKQMHKDYDDFRKQALAEYSEFVRQAWKKFDAEPAVPAPKEEEILPQLAPGADQETASWFGKQLEKLGGIFKKKGRKVPETPNPSPLTFFIITNSELKIVPTYFFNYALRIVFLDSRDTGFSCGFGYGF